MDLATKSTSMTPIALPVIVMVGYTGFLWASFLFIYSPGPLPFFGSYVASGSVCAPPPYPQDIVCIQSHHYPQPVRDMHPSVYGHPDTAGRIAKDDLERQAFLWKGDRFNPAGMESFKLGHVLDSWEPSYHCPFEERVGPQGDGGKWMCRIRDYIGPGCVVYSFGCGGDIRWERDLARLTDCEIHIFDPTPTVVQFARMAPFETGATSTLDTVEKTMAMTSFPARSQFHPWAFYESSADLPTTLIHTYFPGAVGGNLRWMVNATGTVVPHIIKMDIEGSELLIDFRADAAMWKQVHMFLVAVHLPVINEWIGGGSLVMMDLGINPHWTFMRDWMASIEAVGFRLFHKEINTYRNDGGRWELAFVNTNFF